MAAVPKRGPVTVTWQPPGMASRSSATSRGPRRSSPTSAPAPRRCRPASGGSRSARPARSSSRADPDRLAPAARLAARGGLDRVHPRAARQPAAGSLQRAAQRPRARPRSAARRGRRRWPAAGWPASDRRGGHSRSSGCTRAARRRPRGSSGAVPSASGDDQQRRVGQPERGLAASRSAATPCAPATPGIAQRLAPAGHDAAARRRGTPWRAATASASRSWRLSSMATAAHVAERRQRLVEPGRVDGVDHQRSRRRRARSPSRRAA